MHKCLTFSSINRIEWSLTSNIVRIKTTNIFIFNGLINSATMQLKLPPYNFIPYTEECRLVPLTFLIQNCIVTPPDVDRLANLPCQTDPEGVSHLGIKLCIYSTVFFLLVFFSDLFSLLQCKGIEMTSLNWHLLIFLDIHLPPSLEKTGLMSQGPS